MKLKRKMELQDWFRIAAILVIAAVCTLLAMEYKKTFGGLDYKTMAGLADSAEKMREIVLAKFPRSGLPLLIGIHLFQVVVSFIPAGLVQFVGGLIYGFPIGIAIGVVGCAAGTMITFFLSRTLGRKVLTLFVSESDFGKAEKLLESSSSTFVLLLLYMLPFPKDLFGYFLGLTNIKASKVFLVSTLGRFPGMIISTYLAVQMLEQNYTVVVVGVAITLAIMLPLVIFQKKILEFFNRRKERRQAEIATNKDTEA